MKDGKWGSPQGATVLLATYVQEAFSEAAAACASATTAAPAHGGKYLLSLSLPPPCAQVAKSLRRISEDRCLLPGVSGVKDQSCSTVKGAACLLQGSSSSLKLEYLYFPFFAYYQWLVFRGFPPSTTCNTFFPPIFPLLKCEYFFPQIIKPCG